MITPLERKCVKVVADGLRARLPESEIVAQLIGVGLSQSDASNIFGLVRNALKSGVNAAVTEGLSGHGLEKGESELYDFAFRTGYQAFRRETVLGWLRRFGIPLICLGAVIILAIWMLRYR